MRILAVGMNFPGLDNDWFYVQTSKDKARAIRVDHRGSILDRQPEEPLVMVASAVEKFGAFYYVDPPIEIKSENELAGYLGQFELAGGDRVKRRK